MVFAFSHKMEEPSIEGWEVFIDILEYERMGLELHKNEGPSKNPFRLFMNNVDGIICSSYPQRVIIPTDMSDEDVEECSKFRTKERFPAMSYYYNKNGATIWRSSQPKEGLWGSISKPDQKMIQSIIETLPQSKTTIKFEDPKRDEAKLHIFDARPKISAIGNKVMGSGYENVDNYPSTWLWFCNIENIHKIRESYMKLLQIATYTEY